MKKYLSIFIISTMLFGLIPQWASAAPTVNWKSLYKAYVKQVLMDKNHDWYGDEEEFVLVDLDMDGVPELIEGRAYRIVSSVNFAVTVRNGQIVKIQQKGDGHSNESPNGFTIGMYAFSIANNSWLKLYKDLITGEYKYIGRDGSSGAASWGDWEYEMRLSGSTLLTKEISRSHGSNQDDNVTEFIVNNKKVVKVDYDNYRQNYYANLTEVPHGAASATLNKLYDSRRGRVNEAGIDAFIDNYKPSEFIKMNQIPQDWAKAEVDQALKLNLVPDDLQGAYANPISRSDFCRLIMQLLTAKTGKTVKALLSESSKKSDSNAFQDTTNQTILTANALGIVNGKGNGQFDPDGSITRQEAAVMLTRAATILGLNTNRSGVHFGDKETVASWAEESVSFVSATKDSTNDTAIMGGTSEDQFSPLGSYTRQQAIITIKRLFNAN